MSADINMAYLQKCPVGNPLGLVVEKVGIGEVYLILNSVLPVPDGQM